MSHPRKALVSGLNTAIFKAKLKDIKINTTPTIIGFIMGGILLNQDCVYAKDVTQEGTNVVNLLYKLTPPTLLTVAEIYKVRAYIKMYMKNLKLIIKETTSN